MPNQFYASFFANEDLGVFFFSPSKFQLKAERSGVLEQIATKTQYVLNHVTK